MKKIFGEPASGKTLSCFDLCRKENAYLIVSTLKLKQTYKKLAEAENYEDIISRIISFNDYQRLKDKKQIGNKKFVIDEAGYLLYEIFGKNLIGYSETIIDYPKENYTYLKGNFSEEIRKQVGEVEFKYYNEVK